MTLLDVLGSEVLRDEEAKILATIAEVCVQGVHCGVRDGGELWQGRRANNTVHPVCLPVSVVQEFAVVKEAAGVDLEEVDRDTTKLADGVAEAEAVLEEVRVAWARWSREGDGTRVVTPLPLVVASLATWMTCRPKTSS